MLYLATGQDLILLLFPCGDLVDTAARIFIQRNVELLDQIITIGLDVEGIVLGVMLTRLGAVIAKLVNVVKTNEVIVTRAVKNFFGAAANFGINLSARCL